VVFLEHGLGVSAIDGCDLCRLKCLNRVQDLIEVLLYHCPCFGIALLDDTLHQLELKLASSNHVSVVQDPHCRLLELCTEQRHDLIDSCIC